MPIARSNELVYQPMQNQNIINAPQASQGVSRYPVYQYPVGGTNTTYAAAPQTNITPPQHQSGGVLNSVSPKDLIGKDFSVDGLTHTVFNPGTQRAVDSFGNSVFGIGTSHTLPAGVQGPTGITDGLSANFNPANIAGGFAGGLAANAVFGGGTGTTIGSTLGGIAGSFGGPVGAAVGSFIGGGLGSLFGSKPSNRLQVGGVSFDSGDFDEFGSKKFSQDGKKFSQQNADMRDTFSGAAGDTIKYLRSIGAEQNADLNSLVVKFGDRSGYSYFWEPKKADSTVSSSENRPESTFGKDIVAFNDGLREDIISKFNLTPEQAEQARGIFNQRTQANVQNGNGPGGQVGGAAIPMVAGRRTFADFMEARQANSSPRTPDTIQNAPKPAVDNFNLGKKTI